MKRFIKAHRRYITNSKYLRNDDSILFDDVISVDLEIDLPELIVAANQSKSIIIFPGVDKFREDVVRMLENEYKFEVIEDVHNGKRQKGYSSNRRGSISLYFDTYFDLSNVDYGLQRLGVSNYTKPDPKKVYCFIHLRFSDHDLNDEGDLAHRRFVADNVKKYTANRPDITHIMKEEVLTVSEEAIQRYYDEALDDLRSQIETRMLYWVRKLELYKRR